MQDRIRNYKDLLVWQKAVELATVVYGVTQDFPKDEVYGLRAQIRRSAVSAPSNIAEGHARQYDKEFKQYLHVALGSLAELDTQLCISRKLHFVNEDDYATVTDQLNEIRRMIWGLIRKL